MWVLTSPSHPIQETELFRQQLLGGLGVSLVLGEQGKSDLTPVHLSLRPSGALKSALTSQGSSFFLRKWGQSRSGLDLILESLTLLMGILFR